MPLNNIIIYILEGKWTHYSLLFRFYNKYKENHSMDCILVPKVSVYRGNRIDHQIHNIQYSSISRIKLLYHTMSNSE